MDGQVGRTALPFHLISEAFPWQPGGGGTLRSHSFLPPTGGQEVTETAAAVIVHVIAQWAVHTVHKFAGFNRFGLRKQPQHQLLILKMRWGEGGGGKILCLQSEPNSCGKHFLIDSPTFSGPNCYRLSARASVMFFIRKQDRIAQKKRNKRLQFSCDWSYHRTEISGCSGPACSLKGTLQPKVRRGYESRDVDHCVAVI